MLEKKYKGITLNYAFLNQLENKHIKMKSLFEDLFCELLKEIYRISITLELKNKYEIFWINTEATWLGMIDNALLNLYGKEYTSLSEFSIYGQLKAKSKQKHVGRPDLLISINLNDEKQNFLIEGKFFREWKKFRKDDYDMNRHYEEISNQTDKYNAHLHNILDIEINYKLLIAFQWFRNRKQKEFISGNEKYLENIFEDKSTDFCTVYYMEQDSLNKELSGIWIYGQLNI